MVRNLNLAMIQILKTSMINKSPRTGRADVKKVGIHLPVKSFMSSSIQTTLYSEHGDCTCAMHLPGNLMKHVSKKQKILPFTLPA